MAATRSARSQTTSTAAPVRETRNPIRVWFMVLGWVLVATAILGAIRPAYSGLHDLSMHIEGGEMVLHWILALATLGLAYFVRHGPTMVTAAWVFGLMYLATGVVGFFVNDVGPWHVGIGDNILHIALGAVTLAVMFSAQRAPDARTPPTRKSAT